MKKYLLLFTMLVFASIVYAQDVFYLKNGSIIKGNFVEYNPTEGFKFKTADGSLFVYVKDDVIRIVKDGNAQNLRSGGLGLYLKNGSIIKGSLVEYNPLEGVKFKTADGSLFVYAMTEVDHVIHDDTAPVVVQNTNTEKLVNSGVFSGKIDRSKGNLYWTSNGTDLTDEEYSRFLGTELYNTFSKAHKQYNSGKTLQWIGIGISAFGAILFLSDPEDEDLYEAFTVCDLIGTSSFVVGCVFRGIGKGRIEWVKDTYNSGAYSLNRSNNSYPSTLRLAPSLMLTAQRDWGLGASITFSF